MFRGINVISHFSFSVLQHRDSHHWPIVNHQEVIEQEKAMKKDVPYYLFLYNPALLNEKQHK